MSVCCVLRSSIVGHKVFTFGRYCTPCPKPLCHFASPAAAPACSGCTIPHQHLVICFYFILLKNCVGFLVERDGECMKGPPGKRNGPVKSIQLGLEDEYFGPLFCVVSVTHSQSPSKILKRRLQK